MHPRPLRHDGPCGERSECWKRECRAAYPGLATVETLDDGTVLARCHGATFRPVAYREPRLSLRIMQTAVSA